MSNTEYLEGLLCELIKLPKESEWVEFKHNNSDKEDVGSYLTALSNSVALLGKTAAYAVWRIDDETHEVLGTSFNPFSQKAGIGELTITKIKP